MVIRCLKSSNLALVLFTVLLGDFLLAADADFYLVVILLDISAAFDTVDYSILINRHENICWYQ